MAAVSIVSPTTTVEPPPIDVVVADASGETINLTEGAVASTPRGLAFTRSAGALSTNAISERMEIDAAGNLLGFSDNKTTVAQIYNIGTASNKNTGFDVEGDLKWGRWSQGVATRVDNSTGVSTNVDLTNSSLHWLIAPETGPVQVITGTASYVLIGNTDPTNDTGDVGVLGSASLTADFTNSTVASSVQLGIANAVWQADGTGTVTTNLFSGLYDTVKVNDVTGGSGTFSGVFTNYSAVLPQGAGLSYQLIKDAQKVSGVAIFKAATAGPE